MEVQELEMVKEMVREVSQFSMEYAITAGNQGIQLNIALMPKEEVRERELRATAGSAASKAIGGRTVPIKVRERV